MGGAHQILNQRPCVGADLLVLLSLLERRGTSHWVVETHDSLPCSPRIPWELFPPSGFQDPSPDVAAPLRVANAVDERPDHLTLVRWKSLTAAT
jgi:hypothetical protein